MKKVSRRTVLKGIGAGAGALAAGSAGRVLAQAQPIQIGALYPLTGPTAVFGGFATTGAKIAANRINAAGGVLGRKIEIVIRDDKSQPAEAALMARELLGNGTKLLIGGYLTAQSMAVLGLLTEGNAVFQATGTSVNAFTHESFHPNAFRCSANIHMIYYAYAKYAAAQAPDVTRWGGVIVDAAFGESNWAAITGGLRKYHRLNGRIVEFNEPLRTKIGATDYRVQIAALMSQPVDGLYLGLVGADYAAFVNQAAPFGLFKKAKVVLETGAGLALGKTLRKSIPAGQMSFTAWHPPTDTSQLGKDLYKDLQATGNATPDSQVANAHNAVMAYARAIKAAGTTDTKAVIRALEDVSFDTAGGHFKYRKQDHQLMASTTCFWMEGTEADPGYVLKSPATLPGEETIEPATPGKAYVEGT
ncbi:MAG TPA: ABC transporter substrate-binding protein [Burkholderiales bacterium]|nr:ABC transporter substrate-binding protein [Burkholderiales bacterium]